MKNTLIFVAVRVILATILTLLVILIKWEYIQWGNFTARVMNTPIYLMIQVMIGILMVSALLQPIRLLYLRRSLPFLHRIEAFADFLRTYFSRLTPQLVLWGAIIFVAVGFLWKTEFLHDENFTLNQIYVPWTKPKQEESSVRLLNYFLKDNNQEAYLNNCLTIVRDLKAVGARVVLVPLPYFLQSEKSRQIVEEINRTGIVVFGALNYSSFMPSDSSIRSGILTRDIYRQPRYQFSFIQAISAFPRWRGGGSMKGHDVTFEVLRKYYEIPSEKGLSLTESEIGLGDLKYPADAAGRIWVGHWSYSNIGAHIIAGYGMDWFKGEEAPGRLEYSWAGRRENLSNHKDIFDGKIVILQPNDLGGVYPSSFSSVGAEYAQALNNIVKGNVLSRSHIGTLLVALFGIAITGLIVRRARFLTAVTLLMLFWGTQAYLPPWLFQTNGVLVDVPVILSAMILSAVVFTAVRVGNDWKTDRTKVALQDASNEGIIGFQGYTKGFAIAGNRVNLSFKAAIGLATLIVAATFLASLALRSSDTGNNPEQKVVYVMSLPTIEVQGVYPVNNQ